MKSETTLRLSNLEVWARQQDQTLKQLKTAFDERKISVHEKNAAVQREFAEENNRLRDELSLVKAQLTQHGVTLSQHAELFKEFKDLGAKFIDRLSSIERSLAASSGGELTKRWWIERILQLGSWGSVLWAIFIYKG